jgi:hypothetical protein
VLKPHFLGALAAFVNGDALKERHKLAGPFACVKASRRPVLLPFGDMLGYALKYLQPLWSLSCIFSECSEL